MHNDNIFSVSQLNATVRQTLEGHLGQVWLVGEISNFSQPVSGHWYLTLKDENAQVRCAMFRMKNMRVSFRPQNGLQILVRANVSLYEPRGDYQLIIESMHPAGEGLLQQQFEALKLKLAAEGLFAQNLKKNLPHFPRTVGIITSQTGAALQDILHILQRRDPSLQVVIYPTAVQGKDASSEIVQMIELANQRQEVDVLILGRGGGSLEDLWCFNEEIVARAIFHSALPIISAVGHETDITIADFVADIRASTPSAAAELVSRDQTELQKQLQHQVQRFTMAFDHLFQFKSQQLQSLQLRLQHQHPQVQLLNQRKYMLQLNHRLQLAVQRIMEKKLLKSAALYQRLIQNPLPYRLQRQAQRFSQFEVRLNLAIKKQQNQAHNTFAQLAGKLDSLSPLKVLSRGYSMVQNAQGLTISHSQQVQIGEKIHIRFAQDSLTAKVVEK